jgi:hypothetical protein
MPTPPMVLSNTATASRSHEVVESVAAALAVLELNEVTTRPAFLHRGGSTAQAADPFPVGDMDPIKLFDDHLAAGSKALAAGGNGHYGAVPKRTVRETPTWKPSIFLVRRG